MKSDDKIKVVTADKSTGLVCIWSVPNVFGTRKKVREIQFPHYGAARLYAAEYEERARTEGVPRGRNPS